MIKNLPVLGFQDNDIDANSSSIDGWIEETQIDIDKALSLNPGSVQTIQVRKFVIQTTELDNGARVYLIRHGKNSIGTLVLYRNSDEVWATETIGVLPEYQGQNLGTLLYETALADLGKIGSSASLSGGSSKVWKALCLKHKGVFVIPEAYSRTGKPLEVQIKGWSVEGGITYPMFSRSDGSVWSLRSLLEDGSEAAKKGYYLIRAFGSNPKISDNWPFN